MRLLSLPRIGRSEEPVPDPLITHRLNALTEL